MSRRRRPVYGTKDDNNGVTVAFRNSGNGGSTERKTVAWDQSKGKAAITTNIELNTNQSADGIRAAVAHEGSHIVTYQQTANDYFSSEGHANS